MSHLTLESLARLVDEPATADEHAHLEGCAACRTALDEMRAQTVALAALPVHVPPSTAWAGITARLREHDHHRERRSGNVLRIAAAIGLFAVGAATQAMLSAGGPARAGNAGSEARGRDNVGDAGVQHAAATAELISSSAPATIDDATARLRIAEALYTRALLDYATLASPEPPRDAVARLATLEAIVLTTRAALERAPADPIINTYHLAAQAERETLLGQLRSISEAGRWY
jgi:hypothetical protein